MLPLPDSPTAVATSAGESGFAYDVLPAAVRPWLKDAADQVRAIAYRSAVDLIRAGQLLTEVKGKIKARTFCRWIAAELPWSRGHVYRLIAVAEAFGPLVQAEVQTPALPPAGRIEPTALYLLAQPSVPPAARTRAVELAAERPVTAADAREILVTTKPVRTPATRKPRAAEQDVKPPAVDPPPTPVHVAWATLLRLVENSESVHLIAVGDGDGVDVDGDVEYSLTVYPCDDNDRPRNFCGATLIDVVMAAAGTERQSQRKQKKRAGKSDGKSAMPPDPDE